MNKINLLLKGCALAIVMLCTSTVFGQYKLGHINSAELLNLMPEMKAAEKSLETFTKQLDSQYQAKVSDFTAKEQRLYEDIQKGILSQVEQQKRAEELETLRRSIADFEVSAQQQISQKRETLLNPILDNAQSAIENVATENGFNYIFDISAGSVLYYPPSDDIMPLVKVKLGM